MKANLAIIKRERKKFEQDAQLLANRIKLLKLEDEKTRKKIRETRRKVRKISIIKQMQEEKNYLQKEVKEEKERALSEKRNDFQRIREIQRKERSELRSALFQSRREEAEIIRSQRDTNDSNKKAFFEGICRKNKLKKYMIRKEEEIMKYKIQEFQQKKHQIGRDLYRKKIEENEKIKQEKIKEVHDMEIFEMELIKKLENTQALHAHANHKLEHLI